MSILACCTLHNICDTHLMKVYVLTDCGIIEMDVESAVRVSVQKLG